MSVNSFTSARSYRAVRLTEDEKRVVLIQYCEDYGVNHNEEAVFEEYLKFMYIKIHEDGGACQRCAPSKKKIVCG